ncbi:MAG: SDR family oxidoreductase [Myxococcales bacterium]|nr:SDR family oxidoreductase [Myxococcales bacterium]
MTLTGKVAIVTGAAQGIGRAIAVELSRRGARVAVVDRNLEGARASAEAIVQAGGSALAIQADVTGRAAVGAMVRAAEESLGPLDVLVNNVGWTEDTRFLSENEAYWDKVIALNLKTVILCTHAALEVMVPRERGRIVNIASDAGRVGNAGESVYAAAKGGVIAFTKSIAREVARHGIFVNCVAPGPTDTELLARQSEKYRTAMARAIPLRRFARPDEIARTAAFFASDEAAFITGQTLSVSGGLTMVD